jgi:O-antigen/teichoic acid export membrane protein
MQENATERLVRLLRWSEKYTKTDMVYLASAGMWSTLGGIIVSVFALLLSIAFANFLPSEVFGTYQYFISLSSLLAALCLTGMNIAVSQSTARGYEGDLRAAVRAQLMWSVVPIAIGMTAALYYFLKGNSMLATGLLIIAIFTPLTNSFNTYSAFLQGKKEFKRIFTYTMATSLLYYAFIFPTVFFFRQALVLIFVNLAINALSTAYFYFRTLRASRPNDQTDPHTIPYGRHLSVMNTIGTIAAQLDSILVFHFLGPLELAIYSLASMVPERIATFFKFITTAALPKLSNRSHEEIRRHIVSKTLRAAIPGIAVTILYIAAAPFIFHLLFPKYGDAVFFTQLYAPYIITVAANIPAAAIVAMRMNRELYVFNIATPVLLVILQVVLLFQLGIAGILLARLISNTFNICFAIYLILHPFSEKKN